MLTDPQRGILLQAARAAMECRLRGMELSLPAVNEPLLLEPRGVFVSVHADEELRGCIGVVEARTPLFDAVASCAVSAATADARFAPLTLDELPGVRIEISVLSAPRTAAAPEEIEIGKHGVIIRAGRKAALLLPQVATKQGWRLEEFLEAACKKAGLPPAAWRDGSVELETFTAEVFAEDP